MISITLALIMIVMNYASTDVNASLIDTNEKCGFHAITSQTVNLHIHSRRNATGRWKTEFSVQTDASSKPLDDGMELNLKQSVIKCGDKEFLQVQGVLEQDSVVPEKEEEPFVNKMEGSENSTTKEERVNRTENFFFERGAKHTEFSNGNRTVRRRTVDTDKNYGGAISNRPLKDGELFEVKLDEITTKWNNYITIGLTTISPAEFVFPDFVPNFNYNILCYYHNRIRYNASLSTYGRNLFQLKVGERAGVMRKNGDTVHFFVNGEDQGAVINKFPGTIYGIVDMNDGAVQATIINPI